MKVSSSNLNPAETLHLATTNRAVLLLRFICFVLVAPSGFALMVKVYGVMEMRPFVLAICLPFIALLFFLLLLTKSKFPQIRSSSASPQSSQVIASTKRSVSLGSGCSTRIALPASPNSLAGPTTISMESVSE